MTTVGALPRFAVEIAPLPPLATPAELPAPPAEAFDFYAALAEVPDTVPIPAARPRGIETVSLPPAIAPALRSRSEPFADEVRALDKGGMAQKWRKVQRELRAEQLVLDRCRAGAGNCPPAAKRFLAIVDAARRVDGELRIAHVNRAINLNIRGTSDRELYGVEELWATPLKTFAKNAGDCEDYAIAKYVALRELGVPADQLRLVVVQDDKVKDYHAVAAVRSGGRWMILDNRTLAIRVDTEIAEFDPLYVLDQAGVRQFDALAARHRRLGVPVAVSANETPTASTPQL